MAIRDRGAFERALRAAAAVTGVLKRQGVMVAAGLALSVGACSSTERAPTKADEPDKTQPAEPKAAAPAADAGSTAAPAADAGATAAPAADAAPAPAPGRRTVTAEGVDAAYPQLDAAARAELVKLGDCTDGQVGPLGWHSDCCKRWREITKEELPVLPWGCTPWGPPAPPAWDGERLA